MVSRSASAAKLETVSDWVQLGAIVVPVVGSLFLWLSSRRQTDKTGEAEFRDDYLARLRELESRADAKDSTINQLRQEVSDLKDEIRRLKELAADQAAHITVLTDWGINAPGGPPRTPPHWRQVQ